MVLTIHSVKFIVNKVDDLSNESGNDEVIAETRKSLVQQETKMLNTSEYSN